MQKLQYFSPKTIDEVFFCLNQAEGKARIIADGTNFITLYSPKPLVRSDLIDVSDVETLKEITHKDGYIIIGSALAKEEIINNPNIDANLKKLFNSNHEFLQLLIKINAEYEVYHNPIKSEWKAIYSLSEEKKEAIVKLTELFVRIRFKYEHLENYSKEF